MKFTYKTKKLTIKWEQDHIAPVTYIKNDNTNYHSSITQNVIKVLRDDIESKIQKQKTQTEEKLVYQKYS